MDVYYRKDYQRRYSGLVQGREGTINTVDSAFDFVLMYQEDGDLLRRTMYILIVSEKDYEWYRTHFIRS